ncbi:MAG: BatA domain-containing protein, partial [Planctomycetia bacterium]
MPTFDFLPLLWWGLPLAAAPVVIHLINLLRHRKVPWAAMEFLLASQRKYRTRVLLKQLLLLLLRVAAVLGIVLSLAQPRWKTALGRMLGGGRTAHVVLLDDSYSMGDLSADGRLGEASCFDRGHPQQEQQQLLEQHAGAVLPLTGQQELHR